MSMTFITGTKAKKLIEKGGIVLDMRDPVSFRDGTIPNAVNMTLRQLSLVQKHPKTTPVVLLGDPADPLTLRAAVNYVTNYGFANVHAMESIEDWIK